jgi:3-oxocholest-4-en-26-oyl-CoA dehydrogenase beta subunit
MDWKRTEMQEAIAEVARPILSEGADAWPALVQAEVTTLDDLLDVAALLIEVGRTGNRVPALTELILGAPGGSGCTAALIQAGSRDPRRPTVSVSDDRLTGQAICVPSITHATRIVVPTSDGLYVAELADCAIEAQTGTDGDPLGSVLFEDTPATRVGGAEAIEPWLARCEVGICAVLLGLSQTALALTAKYVASRHQFGRAIGSFQAVQQRAADAWIDLQAMEVTLWCAAWRVQEGLPSDRERAIARYWASDGGHRVVNAAQHLHGGFGFDRDYELHRYFLATKQLEFLLGGSEEQLERLGALVAAG